MPRFRPAAAAGAALAATALLIPAAPATARTAAATVIAPATGAKPATLPVLLAPAAARAYGAPVLGVRVRGRQPVRWGSDRLRLDQLRPGDRLGLRLDGRRASTVILRRSGRADSFHDVAQALGRTGKRSSRTVAALQALIAGEQVDLDRVRDRLSGLLANTMGLEASLGTSLKRMRAVQPSGDRRGKAVARAQQAYATRIGGVRRQAAVATRQIQDTFSDLAAGPPLGQSGEGTVVTGPTGPLPQLPGVVGTASTLTATLLDLLTRLGLLESPGLGSPTDVLESGAAPPPVPAPVQGR